MFAESLFDVFDEDKSETLNFYEFMLVKNAPSLDTPEAKLHWIFSAYDTDGGGRWASFSLLKQLIKKLTALYLNR